MKKVIFILIALIFLTSCSFIEDIKSDITGQTITQDDLKDQNIRLDSGKIDVYFCPRDNCGDKLNNLVKSSQKINCAFYELDLSDLISSLNEKNSLIVGYFKN